MEALPYGRPCTVRAISEAFIYCPFVILKVRSIWIFNSHWNFKEVVEFCVCKPSLMAAAKLPQR